MDKSKEYIKMCDCPEIQDGKWKDGTGGTWISENVMVASCCYGVGDFYYNKDFEALNECSHCGHKRVYTEKTKSIWLPRQDQLQEMVTNFNIYNTTEDFSKWVNIAFRSAVNWGSLEQMWLSYVMNKKYNKTWNGKKWELIK